MGLGESKGHLWERPGNPGVRTLPSLPEARFDPWWGLRSCTPPEQPERKTKACVILSGFQDAGNYAALLPGELTSADPQPPLMGTEHRAACACPWEDHPGPLHPESSPRSHRAGLESAVQVKGERALPGPVAVALPAASGQLGTTQPAARVRLGTFLSAWHSHWPVSLPPAGRSLLPRVPPLPANSGGLDPELSWGAGLAARARCQPAPHPPWLPRPGAAFRAQVCLRPPCWKEPSKTVTIGGG